MLAELAARVNRQAFETWLRPTRLLRREGKTLRVLVPSREFEHIGQKYAGELRAAATALGLDVERITFEAPPSEPAAEAPVVKSDAEFAACQTPEEAARLLMRRECIGDGRLVPVIAQALRLRGEPVGEAGYLAWRNYRSYAASAGNMRYSFGLRKFFVQGHVWKPSSWPRGEPRRAVL